MEYNGKEIAKLGFGLMRLPQIDNEMDYEQINKMIDLFLENGFTYFDTAYGYPNSEVTTKKVLVDRHPRESYQLATKLPAWYTGVNTAEEAKQMFYTSLERTGAGYFDFYLLHNLGSGRTEVYEQFGLWDFVQDLKAEGKIKKVGFSIHDNAEALDKILTAHPEVDFVQLQINYADWLSPSIQSKKCYDVAQKHNKPVIIMEPVRGGALANPPQAIAELLHQANPEVSYSSWAIRFAASLDNVITVLSGMSNVEQVLDNIKTMKDFKPLDSKEHEVINEVQEILAAIPSIPCTQCQYCIDGCPANIAIPDVFNATNKYLIYGDQDAAKKSYGFVLKRNASASACIACGACETVCPQKIDIVEQLKRSVAILENE